jgi:DNA-binding SARP family transcriptional activator
VLKPTIAATCVTPDGARVFDEWYDNCYTSGMKTAISLPDPLFAAAEQFAQEQGLSRSELYANALRYYLQMYHAQTVTEALNQVYTNTESTVEPAFRAAQSRVLPKEDW